MRRSQDFIPTSHEALSRRNQELLLDDINSTLSKSSAERWQTKSLSEFAQEVVLNGPVQDVSAAAEIILENRLHGNEVPEILGSFSLNDEFDKQQQLIGIAIKEPELAHAIVANSVGGFHASNSSSLFGILKHGILSSKESRERNIALGSGERTYTNPSARPFISFADWRNPQTLQNYAGSEQPTDLNYYLDRKTRLDSSVDATTKQWGENHLFTVNAKLQSEDTSRIIDILKTKPNSLSAELIMENFPVLYGLDISGYPHRDTSLKITDTPEPILTERLARNGIRSEFAIMNGSVPPEKIPIIAVPPQKIEKVRSLVQHFGHGIDVYPIDPLVTEHKHPYSLG